MPLNRDDLRLAILEAIREASNGLINIPADASDDPIAQGLVDSLMFVTVFLDVKARVGGDVDLLDVPPEALGSIDGLVDLFRGAQADA